MMRVKTGMKTGTRGWRKRKEGAGERVLASSGISAMTFNAGKSCNLQSKERGIFPNGERFSNGLLEA